MKQDLGMVTAYAYAKAGGYTGTEAQFEDMLGGLSDTVDELSNLSASASGLPAGSNPTASYSNGVISLGIPKGDAGAAGATGATGNGIASAVLNSDYTLTLTFTDGTSYTTPSIRGEKGEKGDGGTAGPNNIVDGSGTNAIMQAGATDASGNYSFAQGLRTTASGSFSHAEGRDTQATEAGSHAEGMNTTASGYRAHAEGENTKAAAANSHSEGLGTYAMSSEQHVFGKYNIYDRNSTYVEIVGNGPNSGNRSNARTLDWSGNESIAGSMTLGMGTADETTITAAQLKALLALLNT